MRETGGLHDNRRRHDSHTTTGSARQTSAQQSLAPCSPPVSLMVSLSNHAQRQMPSGKSAALKRSIKNNRGYLSNTSKPRLFYSRPFHGNCFRSRSKWGEDRRLRWRVTDPLSGEVLSKGSPAGTMTGACWTSTSKGARRRRMECRKWHSPVPKPPKRNGRDQKTPDGRSSDRIIILPRRASTTARLPSMQAMARLEMRAWQG